MTHAVGHRKGLPLSDEECLVDLQLPVLPEPGPYDLLMKVKAIALTPVDHHVRGRAHSGGDARVSGWDTAGTVIAVDEKSWTFRAGDEVYYADAIDRTGTNSEYQVVDERFVARKPVCIGLTEAAGLAHIAWEGLSEGSGCSGGGVLLLEESRAEIDGLSVQGARGPVVAVRSNAQPVLRGLRIAKGNGIDVLVQWSAAVGSRIARFTARPNRRSAFIDEAYTLVPEHSPQDFGRSAVDTQLKLMEDQPRRSGRHLRR